MYGIAQKRNGLLTRVVHLITEVKQCWALAVTQESLVCWVLLEGFPIYCGFGPRRTWNNTGQSYQ
jgi:hypothetical protein